MGQKVNTNLLRLNLEKFNWKSKYYAKTHEESSTHVFKDLEIKKYITRIFNIYGAILHNYKFSYNYTLLKVLVSFFLTKKYYKVYKKVKSSKFKRYNFSEHFLESLSLFLKYKLSIHIIFQNLNKSYYIRSKNTQIKTLKRKCLKFRKYMKKIDFYPELINILILTLKKKNSSKLLSEFLAFRIKALKKHNFFLITLKQMLSTFINFTFFSTKGIKITVKGRLNGAPRARTYTIILGNISAQTFKAKINYSHAISYTPNGTFGVGVWIQEICN